MVLENFLRVWSGGFVVVVVFVIYSQSINYKK